LSWSSTTPGSTVDRERILVQRTRCDSGACCGR
jgi:hypothetical protein